MSEIVNDDEVPPPQKKWRKRHIVTYDDYVEFEKECRETFMEFTGPISFRSLAGKRTHFRRNMAKGRANAVLKEHDGAIKKIICAALGEIKEDLSGLIPTLIGIFAGTALLGNVLTPAILAAIAIMIMKSGIAAFCVL